MLQICAHISFQVLRRDLVRSLKRKRPEVELDQVILPMITRCLIAPNPLLEMDLLGFKRQEHNPYSPNLAPMDFDIFLRLKKELRGVRDADKRELELHVQEVVRKTGT